MKHAGERGDDSDEKKSGSVTLSLLTHTHLHTHTHRSLTSTRHHPPKRPLQQTKDYQQSLTPSYVLHMCFFRGSLLLIHRQSTVKNQPINHKIDNSHVLTKVPHNTRET